MMLYPLNVDKIGVKYKKSEFFREVTIFESILKHEEGHEFHCKTKEWMQLLTDENLNVVDNLTALKYLKECKSFESVDQLAINSCLGIYCSTKNSNVLLELLKERSQLLKVLKDEKGSTYVMEKLFKDFGFYRPFDILTNYSAEAYEALQGLSLKRARLYLMKLIDGLRIYGRDMDKDQVLEFESRIAYLKYQITPETPLLSKDWTKNDKKSTLERKCSQNSKTKSTEKFAIERDLMKGDLILEESSRVCLLDNKGFQCDNCHEIANLLPCFDCHCVFYCSSECEMEDSFFHKYECPGLRSKILYLLQSQVDLRNLILAMKDLKSIYLSTINDQMAKNSHDLWQNLIWMQVNNDNTPYYNFFYQKNDAEAIVEKELQKLCTKTLQIMIYLKAFTTFFTDFFGHVTRMSESEIEIFICALIFRHAIIQRTKLMHFKYGVTNKYPRKVFHLQKEIESKKEPEFVQKSMKFAKKFYNECYQRCGNIYFDPKSHNLNDKPLQQFVKKLESIYAHETNKESLEQTFKKTFLEESTEANEYQKLLIKVVIAHAKKKKNDLIGIFKSFAQEVKSNEEFHTRPTSNKNCFKQKFTCLYANLTSFDHSCRPNTTLIPRTRGRLQLHANQKLKRGTVISISYGPHYLRQCRKDRKAKLAEMFIECNCIACKDEVDFYEVIHNEECKFCLIPIYENDGKCLKCNRKTFINVPKHLLVLILHKYLLGIDFFDSPRKLHCILTTISFYQKFMPENSTILQRQLLMLTRMIISSDEPMIAVDMLNNLHALTLELFPAMSLELCDQLHIQFHMYFDMLRQSFDNKTDLFLRGLESEVLEALQQGSKISQMIKEIEVAWGIDDEFYHEFEIINFRYSKLMDEIHDFANTFSDPDGKRIKMVD